MKKRLYKGFQTFKRKTFISLLALAASGLSAFTAQAQETTTESTSDLRYGFRAGLVSSGFYHQDLSRHPHTSNLTGFTAGGFVSMGVLDFLDVSAEVLYLQQGGSRMKIIESDNSWITTTALTRLHNVEGVILAKLTLPGLSTSLKPQILIGPAVGYNITAIQSQDISYEYGDLYYTGQGSEQVRSDFQSLQYGLHLGAGVEIPAGAKLLSVDFRYRYGLNPINNGYNPANQLGSVNDFYSNSFMLTVGYSIN